VGSDHGDPTHPPSNRIARQSQSATAGSGNGGRAWEQAVKLAMVDAGLDRDACPAACPFTLEEFYDFELLKQL